MHNSRELLATQYALDGSLVEIRQPSYLEASEFARLRPLVEVVRCDTCDLPISKRKAHQQWLYEPFQEEPDITYLCYHCNDRFGGAQEDTFFCDWCHRDIYNTNGYRQNYKEVEDGALQCVRCWQEDMFKYGHTEEQLESGKVWVDWFDFSDLFSHGFEEATTLDTLYSNDPLGDWQKLVRQYIADGYVVITDQGPTGLGNDRPDFVTLWIRRSS